MAGQLWSAYLPPVTLLFPAAVFVALFCVFGREEKRRRQLLILLSGAVLSLAVHQMFQWGVLRPILSQAGQSAQIVAEVEENRTSYAEGYDRCTLRVFSWNGKAVSFRVNCDAVPDAEAGEKISGVFAFTTLEEANRLSGYADGIYLNAQYESDIQWLGQSTSIKARMLQFQRELARRIRCCLPQPYSGMVAAVCTGDKSKLTPEIQSLFRTAGISHLLVVSGLHLTLLCGLTGPLNPSGKNRRSRAVLVALLTIGIMAVTGFKPSVQRAGVAMLMLCVGNFFLLPADGLTSLAAAGVLLSTLNSYAVCDVGFQLSFCATAGVLTSAEWERSRKNRLANLMDAKEELTENQKSQQREWNRYGFFAVLTLLGAWLGPSLMAALCTLPVQLCNGLAVSGASPLTNLLTTWMVSPLLVLGLLCGLISFLPGMAFASHVLGLGAGILAREMVRAANFTAGLPFAQLRLPRLYSLWVLLLMGGVWLWYRRNRRSGQALALAAILLTGSIVCAQMFSRDVVTVALIGSKTNPCAVISENGQALVLFRGGVYNQEKTEQYLNQQLMTQNAKWVWMGEPYDSVHPTEDWIILQELPQNSPYTLNMQDCEIQLLHQSKGNLALINVKGYTMAMATGSPTLPQKLPVKIYLGGPTEPDFLKAEQCFVTSLAYDWTKLSDEMYCICAPKEPVIKIRPGRAVLVGKEADG